MSDKILTIYHTTAKKNEESILKNGFRKSKGKKQWLGEGVYFYKDMYYAVQWGFIGVEKKKIQNIEMFKEKCVILGFDLNCEKYNVLDLNTPDGYKIFSTLKNCVRNFFSEKECEEIFSKGDAYLIYILEQLEKNFEIKMISKFDIIFAEYDNNIYKKSRKQISDFNGCKERQVCIKNIDVINDVSVIDLEDDEIDNLFEVVKENRGDLYG